MTVLVVLLALAAAVLVYLARLPAHFEVRRSLPMRVGRERVFEQVRDLRGWGAWSPWLIHEPGARIAYSGDPQEEGGSMRWDGRYIGAGTLVNVRLDPPARIERRLVLLRPFKSESRVWWTFAERDGQTETTWGMTGHMPFFLRFMVPIMVRMVEKDYDLGLALLRGVLDPGAERPEIRFPGETRTAARTALTVPFSGDLKALIEAMQEAFPRLQAHIQAQGKTPAGPAFVAYSKVNAKTMYFECDIALPTSADTQPGPFALKRLGGGRCLAVELRGSYAFLELAWHSAMAHLRMAKLKLDTRRPFLETYENDPGSVAHTNELITRLEVPIR